MERQINETVNIKEIHFEESLYPRATYNWKVAYDYSQSMKTGAKFPRIIIAMLNGKKYLVDGKHRVEAKKMNKEKTIEAIVFTGWSKHKIFIEAVKTNIAHGQNLSAYDKRRIAVKLKEMNLSQEEISNLIQIPQDKLENFVGQRLVNSITGEEVVSSDGGFFDDYSKAILKSSVKHLAGESMTAKEMIELEKTQKKFFSDSQKTLLRNVFIILDRNLLDTNDKVVMKLIVEIKEKLQKY